MSGGIDYGTLRETLLRGGIAPSRVARVVEELEDHHADLVAAALARGVSLARAVADADAELGHQEDIARELLHRPELRSLTARLPWLLYTLLPAGTLVLAVMLSLGVLIGMFELASMAGNGVGVPAWLMTTSAALTAVVMYAGPIVVGGLIAWSALTRRSRFAWPLCGMVVVALLGSTFSIGISWGSDIPSSTLSATVSWIWPYPFGTHEAVRIPLNLLLVLVPYFFLRRHLHRHVHRHLLRQE